MGHLCHLAQKYGTDKYPAYTEFYETLLSPRRLRIHNVLEIGVGTVEAMKHVPGYRPGASLRMWRDYFPDANIVGIDKDSRVLFSEERIRTFGCDQARISDLDTIVDLPAFDLIIDDGSHNVEHQLETAKFFVPKMYWGGLYIIEDVNESDALVASLPFTTQEVRRHPLGSKDAGSLILIRRTK